MILYDNAKTSLDVENAILDLLADMSKDPVPTDREFPNQYKITIEVEQLDAQR